MHDRRPGDTTRRPPVPAFARFARLLAGELGPAGADAAAPEAGAPPAEEPEGGAVEGLAAEWAGALREAARDVAVGRRPSGVVRLPGPYDDGLAASRAPSPEGEGHLDRLG